MGKSSKVLCGIIAVGLLLYALYTWQRGNYGFGTFFAIAGVLFLYATAKV
ncbi:MAG: hypothetical protein KAV80_03265 [Methanomicrobia archaeon]|nr:hypothetical protein [Methanomicrobia archaeon]